KTNIGARSYYIEAIYNNVKYDYEVKAYETKDYSKDRRLIVKSTDPIWKDRQENDFLVFYFENTITENSKVEFFVIKNNNSIYQEIEYKYKPSNGLILKESDSLYKRILDN